MQRNVSTTTASAALTAALVLAVIPKQPAGQGCEPLRFTTPVSLGGQGQAYHPANEWQLTLAYRRLVSNQWFVDATDQSTRAPGGQSPVVKIHSILAEVAYSFSDRYNLRLSIPLSTGSSERR